MDPEEKSGKRDKTTVDLNTSELTITIRHPILPPAALKRDDETITVSLSGNLTIDIE